MAFPLPQSEPEFPLLRPLPRQALGGLSLLLVVALTFGAARAGALPAPCSDGMGGERATAVLPRTVQQAERRLQREQPDVAVSTATARAAALCAVVRAAHTHEPAPAVVHLREALLNLPPPARA